MSDVSTLKTALGLYVTTISNPKLDNTSQSNTYCVGGTGQDTLYISYPTDHADGAISDVPPTGFGAIAADWGTLPPPTCSITAARGGCRFPFTDMTGGSPISNLPVDPVNKLIYGTSTSRPSTPMPRFTVTAAIPARAAVIVTLLKFPPRWKARPTPLPTTCGKRTAETSFCITKWERISILPSSNDH